MRITLSMGEQTEETLKQWFEHGVSRYLLRIEVSNPYLYETFHPSDGIHRYNRRLETVRILQKIGYQVGTGVMIGLPFQKITDLADDLLFFRDMDIDMFGMGPYLEHEKTPLYTHRHYLKTKDARLKLSFKMIAVLRILMPRVNIAATTAMEAIDPKLGKIRAIRAGANVMMPNITPTKYKAAYSLYINKPIHNALQDSLMDSLPEECVFAFGEWGDSLHYNLRSK